MSKNKTVDDFFRSFSVVIISGASSGIGRAMLSRISNSETKAAVFNLSRTPPEDVPNSLNFTHLTCDLSQAADIAAVVSELRKLMPREGRMLLINNSGFGAYGEFPAPGVDHTLKMIDVNVRAPVELTGRLWDDLKARGGQVANVASLAGFQPTPLMTTYAATKSFLLDWSVALDAEAKRHGIRCVAICPGPVSTNFSKAAGFASSTGLGGQTADECADEAVRGMAAARPVVVTGWKHKILAVFSARLPKPWAAAIGLRMIQRLRLDRFVKKA
ncbi:MAG: SDR family NAD(P)-dependent oxidoreductase [Opitutales bacterium]